MKLYIICGEKGVYESEKGSGSFIVYTNRSLASLLANSIGNDAHVVEVKVTAVLPEKVTP